MDDPASIFDIGMLRLQIHLGDRAFPFYNWDTNEIYLSSYKFSTTGTDEELEEVCADWVRSVRKFAGVSTETGRPEFGEISGFARLFAHHGFQRLNQPDDLLKKIDGLFLLRCGRGAIEVSTPLLAVGYALSKP